MLKGWVVKIVMVKKVVVIVVMVVVVYGCSICVLGWFGWVMMMVYVESTSSYSSSELLRDDYSVVMWKNSGVVWLLFLVT